MNSSSKQIEFYKKRIINKIDEVRYYLSDVKYRLYVSMVNECDNYDDIKQLSELDLQISLFEYLKDIKDKLDAYDTNINELNAVCDKTQRSSQLVIISPSKKRKNADNEMILTQEDINELMSDDEATTAMAMMIAMQLQNQPKEEDEWSGVEFEDDTEELEEGEVSIYELDSWDMEAVLDSDGIDTDEEEELEETVENDDDFEIDGFSELEEDSAEELDEETEDFEIDGFDLFIEEDDEEDEKTIENKQKSPEKPKTALKDVKLDFSDEEEDDDIINLDEDDVKKVTFAEVEDNLNDEEDDLDIDIDSLFFDSEEEEDSGEDFDEIDIDSILDDFEDEEDSEEIDDSSKYNDEIDLDSFDINSLMDSEDEEEENYEQSEDEDIDLLDIDALVDSDEEEEYSEEEEDLDGLDSLDLDSLIDDSDDEEDEGDTGDTGSGLDDISLEDIFDIDESELVDTEPDEKTVENDYSNLFGNNNQSKKNTEVKIQRKTTPNEIFLNGTERGRKTQDMFNALNSIFGNTERAARSATRMVRKQVKGS